MRYSTLRLQQNPELLECIPMPRIADFLVKSVVYLYETVQDAIDGRPSGATGFLIGVPFEREFHNHKYAHIYIVTNEHVIHNGVESVRFTLRDGSVARADLDNDNWIVHPDGDDIAIYPVHLGDTNIDFFPIPQIMFITNEFIEELDIGMGDDVFIIGRFRYHEGRKRNLPTARFGYIAQMPHERVQVSSSGHDMKHEAFLVEMRSIGGYSGSPVFVHLPPVTPRMTKDSRPLSLEGYIRLLGVDLGHLPTSDFATDEYGNRRDDIKIQSNSSMSVVVPAWKLQELLDMDEVKKARKKVEDDYAKRVKNDDFGGVVLDNIPSTRDEDDSIFTKEEFERALRKATRPSDEDDED